MLHRLDPPDLYDYPGFFDLPIAIALLGAPSAGDVDVDLRYAAITTTDPSSTPETYRHEPDLKEIRGNEAGKRDRCTAKLSKWCLYCQRMA